MLDKLTKSEKEIIKLISMGFSSNYIATQCNVSERTIEKHRSNIIKKLNLEKDANSLTKWALMNATKIN